MISGSKMFALVLCMALLPWTNAAANTSKSETTPPAMDGPAPQAQDARKQPPGTSSSATSQTLIAALGRPAPAHTPFAEARFLKVLDKPLVVSGELAWLGGDRLQRRVDHPNQETASIANGEVTLQRAGKSARTFSLSHAPQLQVLLDSFVALLGGDAGRLRQAFDISQSGQAGGAWTLTLTPRDAKVAKTVASIVIDGEGRQSHCMQMQEADGDLAIDLLGPLAGKMPAQPTRDALRALCQGAH